MSEQIGSQRDEHTHLAHIIGFRHTRWYVDDNNSSNILPDMLSIIVAKKLQKGSNNLHIYNSQKKQQIPFGFQRITSNFSLYPTMHQHPQVSFLQTLMGYTTNEGHDTEDSLSTLKAPEASPDNEHRR